MYFHGDVFFEEVVRSQESGDRREEGVRSQESGDRREEVDISQIFIQTIRMNMI